MSATSICTVCLEPLLRQDGSMVTTVPCGHTYHEGCLKKWATERLNHEDPAINCPVCNAPVQNVVKLFLSSKNDGVGGNISLSGQELECWRNEYDVEAKSERLKLHANILESNKRVMDDIFEKQKILETYEQDRVTLERARAENQKLRQELFQQIMKHETEMRRMEAKKQLITEVLERNEKALTELKSTREENLDLKRELLRNIMAKQADMRNLTASKQALTVALENQEIALNELKKSREENLSLKKELVEHLHHHKIKMEQLQSHKESLHEIVLQHGQNIKELESAKKDNLELKEELVQAMVRHKQDAGQLAKLEGWLEVLKEEVAVCQKDRVTLKLIRTENHRLGIRVQEGHKSWLQARCELGQKIEDAATFKMNCLIVVGQIGMLGFAIFNMRLQCH